ncbi:MAG: hypothetical protein ACXACX_21250, partial [Candidatus Hodarchaeales archaeon]
YGFTSEKLHMEWLEKGELFNEYQLEEAIRVKTKKIAEKLGEKECRNISKAFLEREKKIIEGRIEFHGYNLEDFDKNMEEIELDLNPLKGSIVKSAVVYKHAYYVYPRWYFPLPCWQPAFPEYLDRQISSLRLKTGCVRLYDGYFFTNPSIRFNPRSGWSRFKWRKIPC